MSTGEDPASRPGPGFQGLGRLGQKAVVTVASQGMGSLLGFMALLAIGRYYAPGAYGAYVFAVSLVGVFSTLFQLGFQQAHQREVAQGLDLDRALGVYARIRMGLLLVMVLVFLGLLWAWTHWRGGFTDATTMEVVLIILASTVLATMRRLMTDTWIGQGRIHRLEWTNFIDSVVYAGTVALLGFGLGAAEGRWIPFQAFGDWLATLLHLPAAATPQELARYIAIGHFLGKLVALLASLAWWLRDGVGIGPWDPELARSYRRFALPVALTAGLALILQHSDVLMVGYFWTTREVGWYGAAQKIANIAILVNIALRGLLMPYFARLLGSGQSGRAMAAFRRVERFLLVAVLPAAAAMLIWPREGLHIFVGDGFMGAAPALQWLAGWALVSAVNMPVRAKHMAAGQTHILVRVVTVNVVVNLVLNLLLIPEQLFGVPLAGMGAEGAAAATFASSTFAYLYNRWTAYRSFGIPLADRAQGRMVAAALAPVLFWLGLKAWLPAGAYDRVWELGLIGVVGLVLYGAALLLTRGLRGEDVRVLRQAMHPAEVVRELRGKGGA